PTLFISATTLSRVAASPRVRYAPLNGSMANAVSSNFGTSGGKLSPNPFSELPGSRYLIHMQLRGCGTALITPFHQDGSLDEPSLRNLVSWQIESGIDFLVPCGTTGETPTLTDDEWLRVIDVTVEVAAGRVPIVAGATSNSTHDAVAKAKEAAERPGVDAI